MTHPVPPPSDAQAPVTDDKPVPSQPIVATYGRYYRNARYIMVLAMFAMAGWFAYDGWVKWPADNQEIRTVEEALKNEQSQPQPDPVRIKQLSDRQKELGAPHTDLGIFLQKLLAIGLPVIAVGYLIFFLRRSRGQYVLKDDTLFAPDHPPVPISAIKNIDGKLWRKKGIAFVYYENIQGRSGRIRLDAFIYSPKHMDDIYEVIARHHGIWEQTRPLPPSGKKLET